MKDRTHGLYIFLILVRIKNWYWHSSKDRGGSPCGTTRQPFGVVLFLSSTLLGLTTRQHLFQKRICRTCSKEKMDKVKIVERKSKNDGCFK
jgi:hypothetical protein